VLRKILVPEREEITEEWRRPHNEELHYIYIYIYTHTHTHTQSVSESPKAVTGTDGGRA
jgi:hypothetical protein